MLNKYMKIGRWVRKPDKTQKILGGRCVKWRIVIWISTLAQDRMLSGPEETAAFMEGQVTDQFELTMGAISISSSNVATSTGRSTGSPCKPIS